MHHHKSYLLALFSYFYSLLHMINRFHKGMIIFYDEMKMVI